MSRSRRSFLAAACAGLAGIAGCVADLPVVGGPPPYAKWLPGAVADAGFHGPWPRYVEPASVDPGSHASNLLDVRHARSVRLPRQTEPIPIGEDDEDATDRPSVELNVDISDIGWQFSSPTSTFRVVHGGGVADAARSALEGTDGFEQTDRHRGFDQFEPEGGMAPPVAVSKGSIFIPPMASRDDRSLENFVAVRRGEGRRIESDDGYRTLVEELDTGAFVLPSALRDPLTLDGNNVVARALDGARGSGVRLRTGGDSATIRYGILYADGTAVPTDAVRTFMTEQASGIRPASMHEAAEVSVSTTGRLAVVDAKLPTDAVGDRHLGFHL